MKRRGRGAVGATLLLGAGLLSGAGACGGGGAAAAGGAGVTTAARPARGGANLIVEAEVATAGVTNAYEAIQRLRPTMLRGRGGSSSSDLAGNESMVVYVDGVKTGGVQTLNNVVAITIKEIRFVNASDATTRFGTGHPVGAIMVTTKR